MGASKKPALPTAAEIRAQINEAEQELRAQTLPSGRPYSSRPRCPIAMLSPSNLGWTPLGSALIS